MFGLNEAMRSFTGFSVLTVAFLISGSILIANNRTVAREERFVFLRAMTALLFIAIIDWATYITSGEAFPWMRWPHTVAMAVTFSLAPFIPVGIANVVLPEARVRWVMIILTFHALFELAGIFGGYVFWVDEGNFYHRGPLYFVYMIAYTLSAIYLVVESARAGHTYQSASVLAVVSILVCMAVGILMQVFDTTVRTTWPAVSMAVLLYFLFYSDMILRSDALTKLLNRRSYEEYLAKPKLPCVVMAIDVDNFKHVNDTYGHAYGDECLVTVASILRRAFGGAGLCFRTGGDEFTVVLVKQLGEVDAYVEKVQAAVKRAQADDGRLPSISIGYAAAEKDAIDLTEAIHQADRFMYEAKRKSKLGEA